MEFFIYLDITHWSRLVIVGGNDDVDVLNDTLEGLEQVLGLKLQLEQSTVHLVHEQNGLDALADGLSQHSLGLHAHTRHAVDDDKGTVSDTKSGRDLRREVDVAGRVDEIDQEVTIVLLLLLNNEAEVLLGDLVVQRDGRRLDGDTSLLLVLARVREARLASRSVRNDTGFANERVS